jgi:prolipoprotein diacylglyceryltransferase
LARTLDLLWRHVERSLRSPSFLYSAILAVLTLLWYLFESGRWILGTLVVVAVLVVAVLKEVHEER